ncbi:MAG: nucleotidyltransferase family protein [Nitrospiraceae bacterium]|nr:MAG: nucleotidyltransferase family protein [Nitrospiraceae bacterium]
MKAMVLAAGLGVRLRPLTDRTPKPLLPIAGRPLLVWNLLLLKRHGITDVLINLHHLGDQIVQAIGDGTRFGLRVAYSHEPALQGTGGGIKQAAPFLKDGPFLVMNGDTLSACDLAGLIAAHRAGKAFATLALREDPEATRWGPVTVDAGSRILQINGAPPLAPHAEPLPAPCMFAGIHVMEPAVLDAIPPGPGSIIDVYHALLGKGLVLQGYRMDGYWSDIGTRERYEQAERDAAEGRLTIP